VFFIYFSHLSRITNCQNILDFEIKICYYGSSKSIWVRRSHSRIEQGGNMPIQKNRVRKSREVTPRLLGCEIAIKTFAGYSTTGEGDLVLRVLDPKSGSLLTIVDKRPSTKETRVVDLLESEWQSIQKLNGEERWAASRSNRIIINQATAIINKLPANVHLDRKARVAILTDLPSDRTAKAILFITSVNDNYTIDGEENCFWHGDIALSGNKHLVGMIVWNQPVGIVIGNADKPELDVIPPVLVEPNNQVTENEVATKTE